MGLFFIIITQINIPNIHHIIKENTNLRKLCYVFRRGKAATGSDDSVQMKVGGGFISTKI